MLKSNKKIINKNIVKRFFHSNNETKNKIFKFKDANLKFARLGGKRNNSSSVALKLDKMANKIPKSSLMLVGIASGAGIAALVAYGASEDTKGLTTLDTQNMYGIATQTQTSTRGGYTSELRTKLFKAYGYFAGSLGLTAAATVMMAKSPLVYRLHQNMWGSVAIGVVGCIGAMMLTRSIDYNKSPILKHLSWGGLIAAEAFTLAPLTVMGGSLIKNAILGTTCIVGTISLLTAVSPSDAWREWSGVYGVGLGVLLGSSIGLMIFPRSNILYNIFLYLGLAVHGWGVYRSNGRIIDHANRVPVQYYDPINESISLYLHTISIFIRIVMMLQNGKKRN